MASRCSAVEPTPNTCCTPPCAHLLCSTAALFTSADRTRGHLILDMPLRGGFKEALLYDHKSRRYSSKVDGRGLLAPSSSDVWVLLLPATLPLLSLQPFLWYLLAPLVPRRGLVGILESEHIRLNPAFTISKLY